MEAIEVKHEDDFSENTKETFLETQEKAGSWSDNEQIEKKNTGKSYTHDPYLGHAAGDYEPIGEDSRFHISDDSERITDASGKENRFMKNKVSPSEPFEEQIDEHQRVLQEEQLRADKIEAIRSSFGAFDPDK
jgi:hypothetical protein